MSVPALSAHTKTLPHVRLVRERSNIPSPGPRVANPGDIVKVLQDILGHEEQEVFIVLMLDTRSRIVGYSEVTRGLLNASLVHPRETFRAAIAANACGIIVAHNHPSGDATPSPEDRAVTRQLVTAGQLLDLPVYDHIIIAGESWISFATAGMM